MKKRILKTITIALTAVLMLNNFHINMKPASATEIISTETENSDEQLIYEHENENGFIERVYLKNTLDSHTDSKNLTYMFRLYDPNTSKEIARNEMYTAWTYGGAVPTYPYLAYYKNTPSAVNASSITYLDSNTTHGEGAGVYFTMYQANFSCIYLGKVYPWSCSVTVRSDGTVYSPGIPV